MEKLKFSGYYVSTSQFDRLRYEWYTHMEYVGEEPVEGSWYHEEGEEVNADVFYGKYE